MEKIITAINRGLAECSGYFLMAVMLMVSADVTLRNLGHPVFGIMATATFLVVASVYFGLGNCERSGQHVRIAVLLDRLPSPLRRGLKAIGCLATLIVMAVATYACALSALDSFETNEAVMANTTPLYVWPVKAVMVLGMATYCLQVVFSIIHAIRGK